MAVPDNDNDPVLFSRRDARRLREVTLHYERIYLNGASDRDLALSRYRLRHAFVTVAITARAGTTPGMGKARLIHIHETTISADNPEVIVDVENVFAVTVAVGTYIIVAPIDGLYSVIAADCP